MEKTVEYVPSMDLSCNIYMFHGVAGPVGETGYDGDTGPTGDTGPEGKEGPTGPEGKEGPTGKEGKEGKEGPIGKEGEMGHEGPTGKEGKEGKTGPVGEMGPEGPTGKEGKEGPQGKTGPVGEMGPEGPTGPEGKEGKESTISGTFISAYSMLEQKIEKGNPIVFETHSAVYGECAHAPNSSEIFIWRAGFYHVYTNIYHLESCQFSVFKNAASIIPNSTVGSIGGSSQNTTIFIMQITEDDMITQTTLSPSGYACKLQLVNNTFFVQHVTLIGSASYGNPIMQVTATITVMLIK
jgi:hypothetical protein